MEKQFVPQVSVIVPIYNGEEDIPELVKALLAQTYPPERVEYLLVDNRSGDGTSQLLSEAATQAQQRGVNLRHLCESETQSAYAARNLGIRAATGEILAFTDADCRPHPDWLLQLVPPFADPEIGIVAGEVTALPGHTWLEKYAASVGMMSQKWLVEHPFLPYGQTANLAIRKEILRQTGLFRPHLTSGGDADICWRIQQQTQAKLFFVPQALIYHRHRGNLRDFQQQWRRYGRSNRYLHDLHGVALAKELTVGEGIYRLSRWLLKEFPLTMFYLLKGQSQPIDLWKTPISLVGFQARSQGQKQAQLPDLAKQIERF